ncbi:hypothetical protein [Rhodobacter sp. NSM]|uniref:hypothetical protein n=1 Tax=Rhodobacter sp. NSM TaxID=3457501 RepID=UPI003FD06AC4
MVEEQDQEGPEIGPDELRDLSAELLRAIEAEPVPEAIQLLARRLAQALGAQPAGEPVSLVQSSASEGRDG